MLEQTCTQNPTSHTHTHTHSKSTKVPQTAAGGVGSGKLNRFTCVRIVVVVGRLERTPGAFDGYKLIAADVGAPH